MQLSFGRDDRCTTNAPTGATVMARRHHCWAEPSHNGIVTFVPLVLECHLRCGPLAIVSRLRKLTAVPKCILCLGQSQWQRSQPGKGVFADTFLCLKWSATLASVAIKEHQFLAVLRPGALCSLVRATTCIYLLDRPQGVGQADRSWSSTTKHLLASLPTHSSRNRTTDRR